MPTKQLALGIGGIIVVAIIGWIVFAPKETVAPVISDGTTPIVEEQPPEVPVTPSAPTPSTPAGANSGTPTPVANTPTPLKGSMAPEFKLPSGYTNADPFLMQSLIGKQVVLVQFWAYTSVNSMRTFPYVNQWNEKYKRKGLTIVSVHTPRFSFEKQKDNVDKAAFTSNILNPIVLDNQYGTWDSWGNKHWPTMYLVDINGRIVYSQKGEGNYAATEAKIQELLVARAAKLGTTKDVYAPFEIPGGVQPIDPLLVRSAETYFGSARNTTLANGTQLTVGIQYMKPITEIKPNMLYLKGVWDIQGEYARSSTEGSGFIHRYNAKNAYLILGASGINKVKVTLDGKPLGAQAGKDIREEKGESYLYVSDERVYEIVKGSTYGEHTLEVTAETNALQVYSLMF